MLVFSHSFLDPVGVVRSFEEYLRVIVLHGSASTVLADNSQKGETTFLIVIGGHYGEGSAHVPLAVLLLVCPWVKQKVKSYPKSAKL